MSRNPKLKTRNSKLAFTDQDDLLEIHQKRISLCKIFLTASCKYRCPISLQQPHKVTNKRKLKADENNLHKKRGPY